MFPFLEDHFGLGFALRRLWGSVASFRNLRRRQTVQNLKIPIMKSVHFVVNVLNDSVLLAPLIKATLRAGA